MQKEIKAVFFDLDGTLLPMDQEIFVKAYFKELCIKMAPYGYDYDKLVKGVWAGTHAMVKNQANGTNEDVFWKTFAGIFGEEALSDREIFDEFYRNEFDNVKKVCGNNPASDRIVKQLKSEGLKIVLASNPVFPETAQKKRMQWAGLNPDDFDYITSYENSHFCKPNTKYYSEILEILGLKAEECVMVGNDVNEDMCASELGIKTFLLTDCLINSENRDIFIYDKGGFDELLRWFE
ncbi:MAG: HAD family hydrolase [Lachnospiraceae bacterium]|nr:HAD family hydrolase [Lachnospiraceae bacterium]